MEVLGLSGYSRSGKDTVADHLVANYGFKKFSFGRLIYDVLLELDPIVRLRALPNSYTSTGSPPTVWPERLSQCGTYEEAKREPEVRVLLQRFGTEIARKHFGDDVWIVKAQEYMRANSCFFGAARFILPNVRFLNEVQMVEELGGQVWRLRRTGYGPVNGHASEIALDDHSFQVIVNNDHDVADLLERTDRLAHYHFGNLDD